MTRGDLRFIKWTEQGLEERRKLAWSLLFKDGQRTTFSRAAVPAVPRLTGVVVCQTCHRFKYEFCHCGEPHDRGKSFWLKP